MKVMCKPRPRQLGKRRGKPQTPEYRAAYRASHKKERAAYSLWYWQTHKEKHLAWIRDNYFRRYGLTRTEYTKLKQFQSGHCAICNKETKLQIDHDHKTKQVRGLLCRNCNTLLGLANDSPQRLQKVICYLKTVKQRWNKIQKLKLS